MAASAAAAYQGAPGAYSEEAARALLGDEASLLPLPTLEDVFDAVAAGEALSAVVPVENCLTGAVPNAYELLIDHGLRVAGETRVRIDHVLAAARGTRRGDVARVLSHPVALAQCRRFFQRHPGIAPVPAFDTAGAVEIVVREADGRSAALASRRSAQLYGAEILEEGFQDHAENWTRFLLAGAPAAARDDGRPRKAIVTFGLPHAPGALHRALEPLAAHGLNLTRIQSQPVHGLPFEYRFIAEMTAAGADALGAGLEALREVTIALRELGDYPYGTLLPGGSTFYDDGGVKPSIRM